jgi:YD repeat-containing protein
MKQIVILLSSVSVVFLFSCKKEKSPESPTSKCRLTEIASTGTGEIGSTDPYTFTSTEKMEYNAQQLLANYNLQSAGKHTSNKTFTYSASYNYQYDANGFVTKQVYQSAGRDKDGKSNSYNYSKEYLYKDARMIKETQTASSTNNGINSTGTSTLIYEYTSDGKLAKYTSSYTNSDGSSGTAFGTYEYTNGKLSKLSFSDGRGGIISPLIEVNAEGLVTKYVQPTVEYRYQYDAEGNQIRQEEWRSGKKTDIRITEIDNKQNPLQVIYPLFKGQPKTNFYQGKNGLYELSHNLLKDERRIVDGAGLEKPGGSFLYSYQYNSFNLPSTGESSFVDYAGKTTRRATMSFTYSNCQ